MAKEPRSTTSKNMSKRVLVSISFQAVNIIGAILALNNLKIDAYLSLFDSVD
ncbi:hypothetical protein PA25_12600 [Pseudoalteromonas sp. A25]|nr:hypothetical protein PA25_12600 [Pseudoalteromonas sp. A25]